VARPTLRQALKVLQEEGYVCVRRGAAGGTFVSELQIPLEQWFEYIRSHMAEFDDILDYRQAVEAHAAYLAAQRRDQDDLDVMEAALSSLLNAGSRALFRQADSRFHNAIGRASRSPRLERAIRTARGEFFFPTDKLYYKEQVEVAHKGHVAVFTAIRDQDAEEAARRMADHIETARGELYEIVLRIEAR